MKKKTLVIEIEIFRREKDLSLIQATRELVKMNYFSNKINHNLSKELDVTFFASKRSLKN